MLLDSKELLDQETQCPRKIHELSTKVWLKETKLVSWCVSDYVTIELVYRSCSYSEDAER